MLFFIIKIIDIKKGPAKIIGRKIIKQTTGKFIKLGNINVKATRVTSWSSGDRRYTKTDYYDLIREGNMNFNRVPVDGSTILLIICGFNILPLLANIEYACNN